MMLYHYYLFLLIYSEAPKKYSVYSDCCDVGEDLSQEEHLDNEFLWNLLLLSQVSTSLALYCCVLSYRYVFVAILSSKT